MLQGSLRGLVGYCLVRAEASGHRRTEGGGEGEGEGEAGEEIDIGELLHAAHLTWKLHRESAHNTLTFPILSRAISLAESHIAQSDSDSPKYTTCSAELALLLAEGIGLVDLGVFWQLAVRFH